MIFILMILFAWFAFCFILFSLPGSVSRRQSSNIPASGSVEDRSDLSGVREPRRPKPSYWPPHAAAAVPENDAASKTSHAFGYSDSPQQPLRLEDGRA